MTAPLDAAGGLSRSEKQELLRRVLVERISRARTAPASFAQERLWFLDRMHQAGEIYNLRAAARVRGPLDQDALHRALGEIVRRHEALRTTFSEADGRPVQVIAPFTGVPLPVEDHAGAGQEEVRRLAAEES
ncbi:MAG TPA: condensation domain-containing protein, partial [Longimicrobiaceae bacterium]